MFNLSFDWFTVLSVTLVIGFGDYFGFGSRHSTENSSDMLVLTDNNGNNDSHVTRNIQSSSQLFYSTYRLLVRFFGSIKKRETVHSKGNIS